MIRERALKLGKSAPLVGVLSEPPSEVADAGRPGVLLVNSGILHRVGACRLHVRIARRLAAEGFQVVRFDFSGIGDSGVRRDDLAFEASAVAEMRETMDQLQRTRGLEHFVPMGLCSGADMAFEAAKVDERVTRLVLLDPWVYRTPRYYLRRYGPRLFQVSAWKHSIASRFGTANGNGAANGALGVEPGPDDIDLPTYVREFPPKDRSRADLQALIARGVKLRCVFSGGQADDYNYAGQFRDAFGAVDFGDQLDESYMPEASHIFTDLSHQRLLIDSISEWMQSA
jgi:pimeloyl-ACP methyl ester carboxylesterase